jgi:transcription antitermination factor NusG
LPLEVLPVPWFCASYHPLMPAIALASLAGFGIETFFPQIAVEKLVHVRGKGRQLRIAYEPLFSGYFFVLKTDLRAQSRLQNTRGVRGLIKFGNTPGLVADPVIELLKAQEKTMLLKPTGKLKLVFTPGQVVEVLRGPLEGRLGVVNRMSREDRVRVLFSLFSGSVPVDMPVEDVKIHATPVTGS